MANDLSTGNNWQFSNILATTGSVYSISGSSRDTRQGLSTNASTAVLVNRIHLSEDFTYNMDEMDACSITIDASVELQQSPAGKDDGPRPPVPDADQGTSICANDGGSLGPVVNSTRKSSLLQRASGREVVISETGRRKAELFMAASHTAASSSISMVPEFHATDPMPLCAMPVVPLPLPVTARKSSLLQRASGKDVLISDAARHQAAQFIAGGQNSHLRESIAPIVSGRANMQLGVALVPHKEVAQNALKEQQTHAAGQRKSSLLQKASGKDVFVSDAARQRAEQFIAAGSNELTINAGTNNPALTAQCEASTVAGTGTRKSSLLQKASGKDVLISESASKRAEEFMIVAKGCAEDQSVQPYEEQRMSGAKRSARDAFDAYLLADSQLDMYVQFTQPNAADCLDTHSTSSPCARSPGAAAPVDCIAQEVSDTIVADHRKSSLLQKASGKDVFVSDAARHRAELFIAAGSNELINAGTNNPSLTALYEADSTVAGTGTRKSSLLQKASGKDVLISDIARLRGDQFLAGAIGKSKSDAVSTPFAEAPQAVDSNGIVSVVEIPIEDCSTLGVKRAASESFCDNSSHGWTASQLDLCVGLSSQVLEGPVLKCQRCVETPRLDRRALLAAETHHTEDVDPVDSLQAIRVQELCKLDSNSICTVELTEGEGDKLSFYSIFQQLLAEMLTRDGDQQWLVWQLKWVMWTFLSYERRKPALYLQKLLRAQSVLDAVKYRYSIYTSRHPQQTMAQLSASSPRKTAAMHFSKSGAMSPLQRCQDIQCLLWPICLCLAVSRKTSLDRYLSTSNPDGRNVQVEATDGWWWVPVVLDSHLLSLVHKGIIRDGCKVVVFTAVFAQNDRRVASLSLQINAVRRAKSNARLGFVPTGFLSRGISLPSIVEDGGPIYAMKVTIVLCLRPVFRARCGLTRQSERGSTSVVLSMADADLLRQTFEDLRETALMEAAEDQEEATHSSKRQRNHAASRTPSADSLIENIESIMSKAQEYCDYLVQCNASGAMFWLRIPHSGGDEVGAMGGNITTGAVVIATNLMMMKAQPNSHMCKTVTLGRNSSFRTLSAGVRDNSSSNGSRSNEAVQMLVDGHRQELTSCAPLFSAATTVSDYLRCELSMCMEIFAWDYEGEVDAIGSPCDAAMIHVLGITEDKHCVEVTMPVFNALARRLAWLKVGALVKLTCGMLMEVDTKYDVLRFKTSDRTTIATLSKAPDSARRSAATPSRGASVMSTPRDNPSSAMKTPKKARFSTPSKVVPRTPFTAGIPVEQAAGNFVEEEKARFEALRMSRLTYSSVVMAGMRMSCARERKQHALVKHLATSSESPSIAVIAIALADDDTEALDRCCLALCCVERASSLSVETWARTSLVITQQLEAFRAVDNWIVEVAAICIIVAD